MAITEIMGWEANDATLDQGGISGTASYDTGTVRTGLRSLRCNPASGASGSWSFGAASPKYIHFAMRVATLPSITRQIFGSAGSGTELFLTSTGTITYKSAGVTQGTSSQALSTGIWYWIGVRIATGTSVVCLQIDGTNQVTGSPDGNVNSSIGFSGIEASAADVYFDDLVIDGAGFLAASKVALLLPISDNARATLWTGGTGGTTNLFDAVNNTPPIGTATETNLTQIEHGGGAAGTTDAYDANMTTYATAGILTGDTVLGLEYFIAHGEDVATGTKLLNFSLASNPAQASGLANFAAGSDVGALGTYPSNWTVTRNTVVTSPSVTLASSPVMRVTRPETATRVASVCFMGIYVAWTPVTTYQPRHPGINHQNPALL